MQIVKVKKLNDLAVIPTYADSGASGFDLYSTQYKSIRAGGSAILSTGIAFEIPEGYEIQIRGRSGLAFNEGVIAHFGTIDASYRGEIKVKLFNLGYRPIGIEIGDRIAQGVLAPVERAMFIQDSNLSETERGVNGFGSTGQ